MLQGKIWLLPTWCSQSNGKRQTINKQAMTHSEKFYEIIEYLMKNTNGNPGRGVIQGRCI